VKLRLGTRGSRLALAQADIAKRALEGLGFTVDLVVVRTKGDICKDRPVEELGKGMFVKEIERELLEGSIDLAVHSAKDMPSELPEGLEVAAYLKREDPSDCLVTPDGRKLDELEEGAKVGTSSPRRAFQLLGFRSDLEVVPMRGNLDTRIRKLLEGTYDAIVVAYCGLLRLGLEGWASEVFDPDTFLPSPGQGALALEVVSDGGMASKLKTIDHVPTRAEVEAEKAFVMRLGGGCRRAIGALGRWSDGKVRLKGVLYCEGRRLEVEGEGEDPRELGIWLAEEVLRSI